MNASNARLYDFVGRERDEDPRQDPSEQALWQAVIDRALFDALGFNTSTSDGGGAREWQSYQARNWFERNSKDFQDVCFMAGREPAEVRAHALALLAKKDADEPQFLQDTRSARMK